MTALPSREEARESYLIGERIRAKQTGQPWDERRASQRFEALLAAERFDAIGVTKEAVDLGASILMRNTQTGWERATPEQKEPWRKAVRAVLIAVRDLKRGESSKRRHGTRAKYIKDGCLCPACQKANTDYLNTLQERKDAGEKVLIPAGRTQSTLRALVSMGLDVEDIAEHIGFAHSSLRDILTGHARRVRPETEEKVIHFARTHRPGLKNLLAMTRGESK